MIPAKKPLIYVAGPYSSPDPVENTHKAIKQADVLVDLGFAVIVPHLTMLWHAVSPKEYELWLDIDLQHVLHCDAVYRMPGKSSGADGETAVAVEMGIPVFTDVDSLLTWRDNGLAIRAAMGLDRRTHRSPVAARPPEPDIKGQDL